MRTQANHKLVLLLVLSLVVVASADTWQPAEMIQPEELAQSLAKEPRPLVLQVGVIHLYRINHIPGSKYAGMANTAEGLETLKKLTEGLSRDTHIVCYCGCCPWQDCPNVRPAFNALRGMGFKNVRALYLPNNFAQDWVTKGLPVEKGDK